MIDITVNIKPAGNFCNISCGYCDLSCRSKSVCRFSFEAFKVALLDLAKRNPSKITFVLHGGEPLTAGLPVLLQIVKVCQECFVVKSRIQVQTNGVLLSDQVAQALVEKGCGFSVSLDPALGNCRCDIETREIVKKNIGQLLRLGADVGVVSVAHARNLGGYSAMLQELCDMGVSAWTINRVRCRPGDVYHITELDYVKLLLSVMREWIEKRLFRKIRILPILDLLMSCGGNHCCRFSNVPSKCRHFLVFDGQKMVDRCEHLSEHGEPIDKKCLECDDFDFCGGGCPGEGKDDSFCQARRLLKKAICQLKTIRGG